MRLCISHKMNDDVLCISGRSCSSMDVNEDLDLEPCARTWTRIRDLDVCEDVDEDPRFGAMCEDVDEDPRFGRVRGRGRGSEIWSHVRGRGRGSEIWTWRL